MAFSQTINCSLNFVSDFLEYSQNVPFIYIFYKRFYAIFSRETTLVTSWLIFCTSSSFRNGVYSMSQFSPNRIDQLRGNFPSRALPIRVAKLLVSFASHASVSTSMNKLFSRGKDINWVAWKPVAENVGIVCIAIHECATSLDHRSLVTTAKALIRLI